MLRASRAFRTEPILLACIVGFLSLAAPFGSAQDPLQRFEECELVPSEWADGDSFQIRLPDGREIVVRLYYVDCIETSAETTSDKRRIREQARYFGIEDLRTVVDHGRKATDFTREALASPFVIHTSFANARGRSGKPRFYAFVRTSNGEDLGRALVESGLARAYGLGRATPTGTLREEWEAYLDDLELAAAIQGTGVWEHSDPMAIVEMRAEQREELRGLEAIDDALTVRPPSAPVDVNTASLEDLTRTGLRESLADLVIQGRPFKSVDDLIQIRGIGPVTLKKIRPYLTTNTP